MSIRVYPPGSLTSEKLRNAVKLESEAGARPTLLILEGFDIGSIPRADVEDLKALAGELEAEVWLEAVSERESDITIPPSLAALDGLVSVILALEPGSNVVQLRALKDHDNPDLADLHVSLDPRSLLLVRS
jgi:hypothetical protein